MPDRVVYISLYFDEKKKQFDNLFEQSRNPGTSIHHVGLNKRTLEFTFKEGRLISRTVLQREKFYIVRH